MATICQCMRKFTKVSQTCGALWRKGRSGSRAHVSAQIFFLSEIPGQFLSWLRRDVLVDWLTKLAHSLRACAGCVQTSHIKNVKTARDIVACGTQRAVVTTVWTVWTVCVQALVAGCFVGCLTSHQHACVCQAIVRVTRLRQKLQIKLCRLATEMPIFKSLIWLDPGEGWREGWGGERPRKR